MNDIKKALVCCINGDCSGCPLYAMNCSSKVVMAFAVDLSNRQNAEIERLQSMNQSKLDMIHDLRAEIERLQGFADNMEYCANHALDDLEKEKNEAIKEFAERLKETKFKIGNDFVIYAENIDNLVKEMVGEHDV